MKKEKRKDPCGNINRVYGMFYAIKHIKGYKDLGMCYGGETLHFEKNGRLLGEEISRAALEHMKEPRLLEVMMKEMKIANKIRIPALD